MISGQPPQLTMRKASGKHTADQKQNRPYKTGLMLFQEGKGEQVQVQMHQVLFVPPGQAAPAAGWLASSTTAASSHTHSSSQRCCS